MDVSGLTLRGVVEGVRSGAFSSEECVRGLLAAMAAQESGIKAFLTVDEEGALRQARFADALVSAGQGGALCGAPLAIKDSISVAEQPCTCGSRIMEGYAAPFDATVVARLRSEGAVFLGRTNMDEFGMGSSTEYSAYQVTANPHDLARVAGGSSGGSAAAVASGMALAALGSETGGSIRQPAAYCGCVGLKPSYGRVSRYGLMPLASSMDQVGVLTKNVEDAAILLGIMAGRDPCDSMTCEGGLPDYGAAMRSGLKGLKIGVPEEYFCQGLDKEVAEAVREAIGKCAEAGAEIVEVSLPHTEYAVPAYCAIAAAEGAANLSRIDGVRYGRRAQNPESFQELYDRSRGDGLGAEVKRRILLGTHILGKGQYERYFAQAQRVRRVVKQDFERVFALCDVVMAPVTPTVAFHKEEGGGDPLSRYLCELLTAPAGLAGICALAVPCGQDVAGLPIGVQFMGPHLGEELVLRAGYGFEREARP